MLRVSWWAGTAWSSLLAMLTSIQMEERYFCALCQSSITKWQVIHLSVNSFSGTTRLLSSRSARHLLNNSRRAGSQVNKSTFNSIHRNKLFCPPQPALSRHCWKALGGVCPQQGCCSLHRLYQVCNSLTLKAFNLINMILEGVGRLAQW